MARKTVDKTEVEKVQRCLLDLMREATQLADKHKADGHTMSAEYFSGRWEGLDMAFNALKALQEGWL